MIFLGMVNKPVSSPELVNYQVAYPAESMWGRPAQGKMLDAKRNNKSRQDQKMMPGMQVGLPGMDSLRSQQANDTCTRRRCSGIYQDTPHGVRPAFCLPTAQSTKSCTPTIQLWNRQNSLHRLCHLHKIVPRCLPTKNARAERVPHLFGIISVPRCVPFRSASHR